MTRRWSFALTTALLLCAGVVARGEDSGSKPFYSEADGRIRIVGYNDMASLLSAITQRLEAHDPRLHFDLVLNSTRSAPPALLDGSSLLAPMGAAMAPAESAAIQARWCNAPVMVRIAHDSLTPGALSSPTGIFVSADNPLRAITLRKARRVFTAAPDAQWGELGLRGRWRHLAIHPIGLAADTAIGRYLLDGPLKAGSFAPGLRGEHQSRDVAAALANDAQALGLANLNQANGALRALAIIDAHGVLRRPDRATLQSGAYPLDRFLLVYARRDCHGAIDPLARAVLGEILSDAGQAIIAADPHGYLPLNRNERRAELAKLQRNDMTGSATTAMASLAAAWEADFRRQHKHLQTSFAANPGPPLGKANPAFERFLEGEADFALLTREISEADLATFQAHHRGASPVIVPAANGAWNSFGNLDAVAIVVNAANPIRQLNFQQIDAIFSTSRLRGGQPARHWGDVGGEAWRDRPIHIVGSDSWAGEESARALTIRRHVLSCCGHEGRWRVTPRVFSSQMESSGDSGPKANKDSADGDGDVIARVAADPLAIGFTGVGHVHGPVRIVPIAVNTRAVLPGATTIAQGRYPLARTIDLLFAPPGNDYASRNVRSFARYLLSTRGQALIARSSPFLPLNAAQIGKARAILTGSTQY